MYAGDKRLNEEQKKKLFAYALNKVKVGAYGSAADILCAENQTGLLLGFGRRLLEHQLFQEAFLFLRQVECQEEMRQIAILAEAKLDYYIAGAAYAAGNWRDEFLILMNRLIDEGDEDSEVLHAGAAQELCIRWTDPPLKSVDITPEEQSIVDTYLPRQ